MRSSKHAADYPFFDHDGPLPFAHRGGATYPPNADIENSMRAFENAVELGYPYLETDVHATADGVPVAFHDATLDRVTDRTGRIAELPYDEVAKARIGGREPIPRLDEVFDAWPDMRLNIDVKHEGAIRPLAESIVRARAIHRVCIASFSSRRLNGVRRLLPRIATSLAPCEAAWVKLLPRRLGSLFAPTAPCVQVPIGYRGLRIVTPHFVGTVHDRGQQLHVWTVDDRATIEELLDLGVDGIISDRIDVLREVLVERGQWKENG